MVLLDYEFLEDLADVASVLEDKRVDVLIFSPLLACIVLWAKSRGCLSGDFVESESFVYHFNKLKGGEESVADFVCSACDGKIVESMFGESEARFFVDYINGERYQQDLERYFNCQLWYLPHDIERLCEFFTVIDKSFGNYRVNSRNFPDLVVFDDPDELIEQRALVGEFPAGKITSNSNNTTPKG